MRKDGLSMHRKLELAVASFVAAAALAAGSGAGASPPLVPGTIAFSADNQIFLVRNGKTAQFTRDKPGVVGIAWSPDGSRLLAWRYRRVPAISVVNSDGSVGARVAVDVAGEPRWSPDGKWVAFQRGREIYVAGADGRRVHRLATKAVPANMGTGIDWSPDGMRLVYIGAVKGRYGVFVVPTSVKAPGPAVPIVLFQPGAPPGRVPAWSPDGSTIALETGFDISLVNPDGTGLRHLPAQGYVYGPVWSPDASKLAFTGGNSNYVINADGTGLKQLPGRVCKEAWPGFAQRLSWSPDGSMIAYSGGTGPASCSRIAGIYVEKLDGSAPLRVAYSPTVQYSRPLWRPARR
jgi:Tol biopolymer transport system component